MDSIHILGGVPLQGRVCIQGSKNAALPILAATLLTKETSHIRNCPRISDVYKMISLLKSLGCRVKWVNDGLCVNTERVYGGNMPREAITAMRSSLCLLGAMLGRCREVVMEYPGGCVIGERPIDLHIKALQQMGVCFQEKKGRLHAYTKGLHGADIELPFASVGATENIILAAVLAEGTTRIRRAAMEPEVVALCEYLSCCGACIEGSGTAEITITGKSRIYGVAYRVPSDRIVAGTYLFGCIGSGGNVLLENAPVKQMKSVLEVSKKLGAQWMNTREGLYVQAPKRPRAIPFLQTQIYPGFPTDLQSALLAVLTMAEGESMIEETIFENRFRVVEPLRHMGARLQIVDTQHVRIEGVDRLCGRDVEARELRGGAALILAGMMAEGETVVRNCSYIYRGYENICKDLRELGARIVSV